MNGFNPEQWKRDDTPHSFFNPLTKEVSIEYFNDANERIVEVIPPTKLVTYPNWLAKLLMKHLCDVIVDDRFKGKYVSGEERQKIMDEIDAKL